MLEPLRPTVFLDRDGTLMEEADYCRDPRDVRVFDGAPGALRELKQAGFSLVIATNQSGIGRGRITPEEYGAVHRELLRQLGDGLIDATYFCPHRPDESCACRKPLPGMIEAADREHPIDRAASWMVGDKRADIGCGRAARLRTVLVLTGYGDSERGCGEDFVAKDIVAAAAIILRNRGA